MAAMMALGESFRGPEGMPRFSLLMERLAEQVHQMAVATADKPEGPFKFLGYSRPIRYDFGYPANDRTRQQDANRGQDRQQVAGQLVGRN